MTSQNNPSISLYHTVTCENGSRYPGCVCVHPVCPLQFKSVRQNLPETERQFHLIQKRSTMANQALGSASAPTDDSDLEDLIAKEGSNDITRPVEKFNLDTIDHPQTTTHSLSPFYLVTYTCALCLSSRFSKCLAILLVLGLLSTIMNPTQKTGIMGADYSSIQSSFDLSLSQVHHWCISGDNDSCMCEDPLEPMHRQEFKSWNAAHKANVAEVNLYRATWGEEPTMVDVDMGKPRPGLDVAFLGESVVEAMDGRWLGKHILGKEGENQDFRRIDKVTAPSGNLVLG